MEDVGVKALVIGVSLFLAIITLTIILSYYKTALGVVETVGNGMDAATAYDYVYDSTITKAELTGLEVRSLINKYIGKNKVRINLYLNEKSYENVNTNWIIDVNDNSKVINEAKLNIIDPVWNNSMEKIESGEIIILNITLNT